MFKAFNNRTNITRTRTNVRLLLRDQKKAAGHSEFTKVVSVILEGTMEVTTLEQVSIKERGEIFMLHWWVGDMPSQGESSIGTIRMNGNPNLVTTGTISQKVPGQAFPATLEAAVYQVLEVPGYGKLHNKFPVIVTADVDTLPPLYSEAACRCATLYDEKNIPQGIVTGRSLTFLGPAV
jgi:hypothetical protein